MPDTSQTGGATLSDADRDLLIRTVIGEAANQPDIGKAAVAHVVMNRLAGDGYGNSVRNIVLAPNQFEPWNNRSAELMGISPQSPSYQSVGRIVDAVTSGAMPDVTGGSTHFYAPKAQAALGRKPPAWDDGNGLAIGGHLFFSPNGSVNRSAAGSAIDKAMGVRTVDLGTALPYTATASGGNSGNIPAGTSAPANNSPNISDDDLLRLYGPKSSAAPTPAATPSLPVSDSPARGAAPSQAAPLTDDDLMAKYGPKAGAVGPAMPTTAEAAKAAVPQSAAGQIDILAANRQLPPAIAKNSIANIAAATGVDPATLTAYYEAQRTRPMSTSDAVAEGLKQGVSLGLGPAIGGAMEAAAGVRPFSQGMAARVGDLKAAEEAHPYVTLGGEVAGALPTLAVAGGTTLGGRALGLTGENLLTRGLAGGATNMLIGGTDAAVRSGGDWNDIAQGAKWGGVVGGVAPVAGKVIGSGYNMLMGRMGSPMPGARAENALIDAISRNGQTPASVGAELAQNPRLAIMDVNPGAQEIAKGLATTPGRASGTLNNAYQNRVASAPGAVSGAFDEALGATPDVKAVLDGLQATARQNASKGFGAALNNAPPVDTSKVIAAIDAKVNPIVNQVANTPGYALGPQEQALVRIKSMLTDGKSVLTDPTKLHAVQSSIRTEAQDLLNSATGSDRQVGRAMMDMRNNIVGAIDDAAGGKYRPALSQYADDMGVRDAFHRGLDVFRNRAGAAGLEDRPEYWRDAISKMSPDEQTALRQGVRTAVDQRIGAARNPARAGEAITDSDLNKDKLAAILGDKEAGQLSKRLADEQKMAATNRILFEGSQTEPRRQAAMTTAVRNLAPLSMEIGLPSFAALTDNHLAAGALAGLAAARRAGSWIGNRSDLARNNLLAGMVSASGADVPPVIQMLQNRLMMNAQVGQGVGRGVNLLMDAARPAVSQMPSPTGGGPGLPWHGR